MYTPSSTFSFSAASYTPSAQFAFVNAAVSIPTAAANITLDDVQAIAVVVNLPPPAIATANITLDDVSAVANVFNPVAAVAAVTLDDVSAVAKGWVINNVAVASVTLDDAIAISTALYTVNVVRPLRAEAVGNTVDAAPALVDTHSAVTSVNFIPYQAHLFQSDAQATAIDTLSIIVSLALNPAKIQVQQQDAVQSVNDMQCLSDNLLFLTQHDCVNQQDAKLLDNSTQSEQVVVKFTIDESAIEQDDCYQRQYRLLKRIAGFPDHPYTPNAVFNFQAVSYTPLGIVAFATMPVIDLLDATVGGVFFTNVASGTPVSLLMRKKQCTRLQAAILPPWGKSPHIDLPRPPPAPSVITSANGGAVMTIPTRSEYTVNHSLAVVTVIGNTPIPLSKVSLSYDVDSYAWSFSGVLKDKNSLPLVMMTNDNPVQLSITMDGHNWVVIVESIEQSQSFGNLDRTLKGRSLSALLGAPYQLLKSWTAGSDMTVQQIANILPPVGWVINWLCAQPWIVPAHAYSYTQQSFLQALASIAQNIGAVLVPSMNTQELTIQPRYPVLPWNFNAAGINPDLVIPESALITVNTQSRTVSTINAVYVHGGQLGGVLGWCRLTGTAGDVLAPTASNNLITDEVAARALAERILAGLAEQPLISSFTIPLGGDFPLAQVGQLVEVTLGGIAERAIINGVAISAEFGKVSQTITVGENTNNSYSKLMYLLPSQPLLVGTLVSTTNDTSILTLLDGGVITARGTGTVGANYYVRNGFIESDAPNLTQVEIVI